MADLNRIKANVAKMAGMNAPEGDIDGYIASEGVTVDDVKNHSMEGPGFIDRVKQDYQNRVSEGQQAADAYEAGQQSLPLTYLDFAGKIGAGTGADVIGEAVKSAADYAPQGLKDAASSTLHFLANTAPGREAIDAAHYIGGKYQDIAQRYPNAARHVEAAANIGGLLAPEFPVKGTSVAGSVVDKAAEAKKFLTSAGKDLIEAPPKAAIQVPDRSMTLGKQAKEAAAADYNYFDEIGGGINKDQVGALSDNINSLRPKDPAKAAIWDRSGIKDTLDTVNEALKGGELSFSGTQALRADVNSKLKMAYMAGDSTKANHLLEIKQHLTDVLTNPDSASHLDIEAKNAWGRANHEFAKGSLLEDLELLAAKAAGKAQPANSLDTVINNFLNDKKLSSALRPHERAALEDVVKKTHSGELLKSGATRLLSTVGAATGGVTGFLVGHYGSMLSRTTAEAMKLRKLDKVYELINSRAAPEALTHKPPLLLTHDRRGTLERGIEQRKAYEASNGQSGPPINLQGQRQLALPSPETPTPPGIGVPTSSIGPMSDRQVSLARKIMEGGNSPAADDLSGTSIKTPASQSLKLQESLKGIRAQQLNNLRAKLIKGEVSQNKFTETAKSSFGLTSSQARSLAKEIMKYDKN